MGRRTPAGIILPKNKHFKDRVDLKLAEELAQACAIMLQTVIYPQYAWGVKPSVDGTVIDIIIGNVPGDYGVTIKTKQLQSGTGQKKLLMRECGALLERYHLDRGKHTAIEETGMKQNRRGEFMPEGHETLH